MSLDVSLRTGVDQIEPCRHCGGTGTIRHDGEVVFDANITHNLGEMAAAADLYDACWRPEEIGITKAGQLIDILRDGLNTLRSDPVRFRAYNPPNGWGSYDGLVSWVEKYLAACEEHPDADVAADR